MNMFSRIIVVALAILVVSLGVTTLAFSKRSQDVSAQLDRARGELVKLKGRPGRGSSTAEDRLRDLLNQQEEANSRLRTEIARLKQTGEADTAPAASTDSTNAPAGRSAGNAPWFERLRQEDPERYKQMMEQREQRRKAVDEWFKDKINELDQRAQTATSQDDAELASQIADTLAKLNELRGQWAAVRDLPEDERRDVAQQLQADTRDTYRTLNDLRTQYQDGEFGKVLNDLGITDPKVVQAGVVGINKALDDSKSLVPRGGGGGWGGGGPGGRGGGDAPQTTPPPSP